MSLFNTTFTQDYFQEQAELTYFNQYGVTPDEVVEVRGENTLAGLQMPSFTNADGSLNYLVIVIAAAVVITIFYFIIKKK